MRIVSLLSSATEMLFALGLGEQVVAISHECDYPAEATRLPRATRSRIDSTQPSGEIDRQVKRLLEAGEPLYEIDGELIRRLAPGLIVTQAQCDVCAVRYQDVIDFVAAERVLKGCKIISLNPQYLMEIFQDVLNIGQATDQLEKAERLKYELVHRYSLVLTRTIFPYKQVRPRV